MSDFTADLSEALADHLDHFGEPIVYHYKPGAKREAVNIPAAFVGPLVFQMLQLPEERDIIGDSHVAFIVDTTSPSYGGVPADEVAINDAIEVNGFLMRVVHKVFIYATWVVCTLERQAVEKQVPSHYHRTSRGTSRGRA